MRKALFLFASIALLAPVAAVAAGQFVLPGNESGSVVINQGDYDDLYTVGGSVSVGSGVRGDLFAMGGEVTIGGTVGADLFAAGGTINVTKAVTGDARIVGGSISVNAPVNEDLMLVGGSIVLSDAASVGGDVHIAGGNIMVRNDVKGLLMIRGGEVYINGTIAGLVDVTADKLTFGPQSNVTGPVRYKGLQQATVESGAVVPDIDFTMRTVPAKKGSLAPVLTAGLFIALIGKLLAALLLYKFFGRTVETVATTAYTRPWQSLGLGFVGMIVIPISILILLVIVFGFYIALIAGLWFVAAVLLTGIMAAVFTGALVFKWIQRAKELQFSWWSLAAGVVVLGALKLIPVIGWFAAFVLFLMTFGGMMQTLKSQIVTIHMKK